MYPISVLLERREPVVNLLSSDHTVADAIALMDRRSVGAVLVTSDNVLVGIFTERDVVRRVLARGRMPAATTLLGVMTRDPVVATPDENVRIAVEKMQLARCRHLPVLIGGQVADTLSMRDLVMIELHERRTEVEQMQHYIRGSLTASVVDLPSEDLVRG